MMRCNAVRRTERPQSLPGKDASADNPEPRKRTPRSRHASATGTVMPNCCSAAIASGISASPQALSIGGLAPSATMTRNPCWRAAIAAASPAGPPPITNTSVESVESGNPAPSPSQKYQLRTKAGAHCGQQAQRSRFRAPVLHHIFQHAQDRRGRKISHLTQTIPGGIELPVVQPQCVGRCIKHFRPSSVQNEALKLASIMTVVCQECVNIPTKVFPNQGRNLSGQYDAEAFFGDAPAHHV